MEENQLTFKSSPRKLMNKTSLLRIRNHSLEYNIVLQMEDGSTGRLPNGFYPQEVRGEDLGKIKRETIKDI